MKKYLVVGNPIEHSLSPKLQNYWINSNNIEAIYGKLQAYDNDLKELCNNIKNGQLDGINITVPFKKKIIPYLDVLSGHALRTQSVNTVCLNNGNVTGYNTDIDGFELSLKKLDYDVSNKKIIILGAGGVVPSIIYALKKMNVTHIYLSNRTKEKAQILKNLFDGLTILNRTNDYIVIIILSLLLWSIYFIETIVLINACGLELGILDAGIILFLGSIAIGIPALPGSAGTYDAGIKYSLMIVFSIASEKALNYAIVSHAVAYFPLTIIGFFYFLIGNVKLNELKQIETVK